MKELLLYTCDVEGATAEVESLGGQVRQVFTPSLLVAVIPEDALLTSSTPNPPEEVDDITRMMAAAWRSQPKRDGASQPIPWDAPGFEPPG